MFSLIFLPRYEITDRAIEKGLIGKDEVETIRKWTDYKHSFYNSLIFSTQARIVPKSLIRYLLSNKEFFQKRYWVSNNLMRISRAYNAFQKSTMAFSIIASNLSHRCRRIVGYSEMRMHSSMK